MREMEFRFNLLVWTGMDFVFLGMTLVSASLIFGQVESVAGWSYREVLLLVYTTALFNDFMWTFVFQNVNYFSELVRRGNLDFALLKPVNSRFLVSARYLEFDHYLRMILLFYLINKTVLELGVSPNLFSWLSYDLAFFLGLLIFYNLFFMLTTLNFWFIRIFNLVDFFETVSGIGRNPVYIFKKGFRLFFVYLIPTIFIATFPVEILLGRREGGGVLILALAVCLIFFVVSQKFWNFALKRYSSASS